MQYRPLGATGLQVSGLAFGGSSLGGAFREIDEDEGIRAVRTALDLGVNLIDVAPYYGLTRAETVLGRALRGVPRDRYLLATKVGRYGADAFDFSATRVTASLDESLGRLGVEYVDLIQCHDIEFGSVDQVVEETIPALRRVQAQGKARFIGVTGYPLKPLREVVDRTAADTVLSYCRCTLCDTAMETLLPLLQARGIGAINAAPLAMGLLTAGGPPAWHPAPPELRAACAEAARYCRARGVDIAQLAIQFAVTQQGVATTVVGTASPEEMLRNVEYAATPSDPDLLAGVLQILSPVHNLTWPSGRPENQD